MNKRHDKARLSEEATRIAVQMIDLARDGQDITDLVKAYEETMELIQSLNGCELYIKAPNSDDA